MNTEATKKSGKLFIVSTPIGNKDDISIRAMSVLKICDFVLCEEIKEGAKFLKSINLQKQIELLNEQNEVEQSLDMLSRLEEGAKIALISDCGTPLFADPGHTLVRAAIKADIDIEVVPGASSIMTALVRSGLDISSFVFAGFVSRKADERAFELKDLAKEKRTVVLLETPYRFSAFLETAAKVMPKRNAYIGMNLTMPYETHHYGTFSELHQKFENQNIKAEFVVCFEGNPSGSTFEVAADAMFRGERTGRPRQDKEYRPSGNREGRNFPPEPYSERGGRSERPFAGRSRSDSPRGDRFSSGSRDSFKRSDKPFSERNRDDAPRGDRFSSGSRDSFKRSDKPFSERNRDDAPRRDRFSSGSRDSFKRSDKPYSDRNRDDAPRRDRSSDSGDGFKKFDKPFKKKEFENKGKKFGSGKPSFKSKKRF